MEPAGEQSNRSMSHRDPVSHAQKQKPLITDTWEPAPARIPFPDCIPVNAGAGFIVGGAGGSVFHFLKALRSSPSGRRVAGGVQAVRANAPRLAGTWTALSLAFSAVDSAMYSARRKEDPWNHIVAFAGASGIHRMRKGLKAAVRSGLVGAVCWGLFEVSLIGMEDLIDDPRRKNLIRAACPDGMPDESEED